MRMTYYRASLLLMAASILSMFVVAGICRSFIVTFWVMATLYTAALAAYSKGKGRSFAWGLLGAFPVIGWLGLAALRDRSTTRGDAPDGVDVATRSHRKAAVAIRGIIVSLLGGAFCTVCFLPQLVVMQARPNAHRLIQPLEAYREAHGVYPDSLEELAAAQEPPVSLDAIHYSTHKDGVEFYLVVSSWDERAGYDSRTGNWKFGR